VALVAVAGAVHEAWLSATMLQAIVVVNLVILALALVLSGSSRESHFRWTLENLMEGCQVINREWRYVYLNEAAARDVLRRGARRSPSETRPCGATLRRIPAGPPEDCT
jgi:hypothetical protein